MPRRIRIQPYLSHEELLGRYRQAKEPIERSHYQIIWLLASRKSTEEVAAITGYSRSWIYELVWGYNRLGAEALGDKCRQNSGAKPLLNDVQQAQLWQALQESPPDGGLWNGPKVAAWMSELSDFSQPGSIGRTSVSSLSSLASASRFNSRTDLLLLVAYSGSLTMGNYPDLI